MSSRTNPLVQCRPLNCPPELPILDLLASDETVYRAVITDGVAPRENQFLPGRIEACCDREDSADPRPLSHPTRVIPALGLPRKASRENERNYDGSNRSGLWFGRSQFEIFHRCALNNSFAAASVRLSCPSIQCEGRSITLRTTHSASVSRRHRTGEEKDPRRVRHPSRRDPQRHGRRADDRLGQVIAYVLKSRVWKASQPMVNRDAFRPMRKV